MKKIYILLAAISSCFIFSSCNIKTQFTTPEWNKCTKSSNWHGSNASWRIMNIVSPNMPDAVFNERVNFAKGRGVNCFHLLIANKADGEYAKYSIYGSNFDWSIDENYVNIMINRIKKLRNEGFCIVLWLIADDSSDYAKQIAANPKQYVNDLDKYGFFKYASTVCLGLEMNEYWNANQVNAICLAVKSKYSGKIATHHTSNNAAFVGFGDILFYQIEPTSDQNVVKNACKKALSYGKPVNFFESYRQENRKNCETAFATGCYAVGNW